jgi:hypothetical protein
MVGGVRLVLLMHRVVHVCAHVQGSTRSLAALVAVTPAAARNDQCWSMDCLMSASGLAVGQAWLGVVWRSF